VKKISLPQEGIETLYGAHDGNLKHIESLLGVEIRTQGDELIVEARRRASSASSGSSISSRISWRKDTN
jgi:phosphate starvation-inducible protein PhoH